ncbi:MAG: TIGR02147 family protein [Fibrobacterales bacterium]
MKSISIYNYFDYRKYLDDYYKTEKAAKPYFSYRYFMKKAGFNSSGSYSRIVDGTVNMTQRLIPKYAKGLALSEKETEYLELMVLYDRGKTVEAKQQIFDQMVPYLPNKTKRLKNDQRDYYSHWFNVVIRESLSIVNIGDDNHGDMAYYLEPQVRTSEVKSAIRTLSNLGLIAKNADGFWKACDSGVMSGSEIGPLHIHNFQFQMMDLAKESLGRFVRGQRSVSTKTFSVSNNAFEEIKKKIAKVHKEIEEIIIADENEGRVYEMNLQLFPVTKEMKR